MENLETSAAEMMDDLQALPEGLVKEAVTSATEKYAAKAAVRHAAVTGICGSVGAAAGSVIPGAGTVAGGISGAGICNVGAVILDVGSGIWTVVTSTDAIWSAQDQIKEAVDTLKNAVQDANRIREAASDPEKPKALKKEMGDEMENIARVDPCLQARRCKLAAEKKDPKQKDNLHVKGRKNNLNDSFGMGDTRG